MRTPFLIYVSKTLYVIVLISFLFNTIGPLPLAQAQERSPIAYSATGEDFRLPAPGVMVHLSPPENLPVLKGVTVYPNNPFKFDFILDKGDNSSVIESAAKQSQQEQLKQQSAKLVKYFLASIT